MVFGGIYFLARSRVVLLSETPSVDASVGSLGSPPVIERSS